MDCSKEYTCDVSKFIFDIKFNNCRLPLKVGLTTSYRVDLIYGSFFLKACILNFERLKVDYKVFN